MAAAVVHSGSGLQARRLKALTALWELSSPRGAPRCDAEALAKALPDDAAELMAMAADGQIHRERLLTWLFGLRCSDPQLYKEVLGFWAAVAAPGQKSGARRQPLEVWPEGTPQGPSCRSTTTEAARWKECLAKFDRTPSPKEHLANHLEEMLQVGCDANRVPFPHHAVRSGRLTPMRCLVPTLDGNDLAFVLPGSKLEMAAVSEGEQEALSIWRAGLAKAPEELRPKFYSDEGRGKSRKRPAWASPAAEREALWAVSPVDVVATDTLTEAQLAVLEARQRRGPLSLAQMERRRRVLPKKLSFRLGCDDPDELRCAAFTPEFFQEVLPTLEKPEALAKMRERWAQDKKEAERLHSECAAFGAKYVVWPVGGERRWPADATWQRHCRWLARLNAKHQEAAKKTAEAVARTVGGTPLRKVDSDASWEITSECSDSSWMQVTSESVDKDWLQVASEADLVAQLERTRADVLSVQEECGKCMREVRRLREVVVGQAAPKRQELVELKCFMKPPEGVIVIVQGLCVCFGIEPTWASACKHLLTDPTRLLQLMKDYDMDHMPASVIEKLVEMQEHPEFNVDVARCKSMAAGALCGWLRAVTACGQAARVAGARREELQRADEELERVTAALVARGFDVPPAAANFSDAEAPTSEAEAARRAVNEAAEKLGHDSLRQLWTPAATPPPRELAGASAAACALLGVGGGVSEEQVTAPQQEQLPKHFAREEDFLQAARAADPSTTSASAAQVAEELMLGCDVAVPNCPPAAVLLANWVLKVLEARELLLAPAASTTTRTVTS